MGKHRITRKQMKKDEFVSTVTKMSMFVEEHWKYFTFGASVVAVIALITYLTFFYMSYRNEKASVLLNTAIEYFHAPVNPGPDAKIPVSVRTFATDDERCREALKNFEVVLNRYGSTKSGHLALYYSGLCLMNLGNYDEASRRLEEFMRSGSDPFITDIARTALAQCYFQKKDFSSAEKIWKEISERSSTLFPKDEALLNLAKSYESQGKIPEAMQIYKRIAQEYPDSPSSQEAVTRLQS